MRARIGRPVVIVAITLGGASAPACSRGATEIPLAPTYGVRVKVDTSWYDVAGQGFAEWLPSLRDGAMSSGVQPPHYSETQWEIRWVYSLPRSTRDGCRLTLPVVHLDVRYVMPRLAAAVAPADSDARAWTRLSDSLWRHERGHASIAMHAALEGADTMRRFIGPSCAGLSMQVDEIMQSVLERYLEEESRYDQRGGAPAG